MKNDIEKIITDLEKFSERTDELLGDISFDTVRNTVSRLKKALYQNSDVPALCAPQIGVPLRLFVVRLSKAEDKRFKVFLNPMIVSAEGYHMSREKCASIPDTEFIVPRRNKVHVAYQHQDGHVDSETFIGAYGEAVQSMIELLDGVTLADYGLNLNDIGGPEAFDSAPKTQKVKVLELYLNQLSEQSSEMKADIENSPELKHLDDTIRFMEGMLEGTITPVKETAQGSEDAV